MGRLRVGIEDVASILRSKIRNVYRSCKERYLAAEHLKAGSPRRGLKCLCGDA